MPEAHPVTFDELGELVRIARWEKEKALPLDVDFI